MRFDEWGLTLSAAIKAGIGVALAFWLGLEPLVQVLIILMGMDILSGLIASGIKGKLASDIAFVGILKKVLVLMLVTMAYMIERAIPVDVPVSEAVAGFYLAHEALSIIENALASGLPVPQILRDALQRIKGSTDPIDLEKP